MAIVDHSKVKGEESAPGMLRKTIASKATGATGSTSLDVTMQPGAKIPFHTHPTDEIIFIHTGVVEARLGNEKRTLTADNTIVATAGVPHGIVNNSKQPARFIAFFPTLETKRDLVDEK